MIKNIEGLNKQELRQLKASIKVLMLELSKDLKKCINNNDYDEITTNIMCLDEYSRLLKKIVWNIQNGQ